MRPNGEGTMSGTVLLVVDDEPIVRSFMVEALRRQGYQVLEAGDAEAGYDIACGHPPPGIHALVTDIRLPGMTGLDLVRRLREKRPDLPALYVSGDFGGETLVRGAADEAPLLPKPFRAAELVEAVARLVAPRPA